MRIAINGEAFNANSATALATLIEALGYNAKTVASAVNSESVRVAARSATPLREGDAVELLAPMRGG